MRIRALIEITRVLLYEGIYVPNDYIEEFLDEDFVVVVAANGYGHRELPVHGSERELHVRLVFDRACHKSVYGLIGSHSKQIGIQNADITHTDERVEIAYLDSRFAYRVGEYRVGELEERKAVKPHEFVVLALSHGVENLDESVVERCADALYGALHESGVVGKSARFFAAFDMPSQVHHAGDRQRVGGGIAAEFVEAVHIHREHEVVDGHAVVLAYPAEFVKGDRVHFAAVDHRLVFLARLGHREIMLVFDRGYILVELLRRFLVVSFELRVDLVVGARSRLDLHARAAREHRVVVGGEAFKEVFEVAAIEAHVVDYHAEHRAFAFVEYSYLELDVARDRDALSEEFLDIVFEALRRRILDAQNVRHGIFFHFPIGVDDRVVEARMEHRHLFGGRDQDRFQRVHVYFAVVVQAGVHHSVVIVAE